MNPRSRWLWAGVLALTVCRPTAAQIPQMKFNDVREVAPGVFFRYSSISATDPSVFGGCNNIWVVFEDYVLVYDANFPKEAGDVIQAIRKTTDKPIRFVVDSHHHGDHAYGNIVWAREGATIVSHRNCAAWLTVRGGDEYAGAARGPAGRKDLAENSLKKPDVVFDDKLVFDDGKQRAEVRHFGHCHTPGDAVLYLPGHKILCTGDACVNGAFNFMGHSDSASWIDNLEKLQQLDVAMILPGHGPPATPELLAKQRRYFVELRRHVRAGIEAGQDVQQIVKTFELPWYEEWTGVAANTRVPNVEHVYAEMTGTTFNWDLVKDWDIYEALHSADKKEGWVAPRRIVVPNLMPARLNELKRIAPDVFFVPVKTTAEAAVEAKDADAVLGFVSPEIVAAGRKLRWVQTRDAGVDDGAVRLLRERGVPLTCVEHITGADRAEQAFGLLLALTRGIQPGAPRRPVQPRAGELDVNRRWELGKGEPERLKGLSMLVVGLGDTGTRVAKLAGAVGMRVTAIDDKKDLQKPDFLFALHIPRELDALLPAADVVVLACPLTAGTAGLIGAAQLEAMKPSAVLINVARGGLIDTGALAEALRGRRIAGAGLDVTDPEPLPEDSPLWGMDNVVITPRLGGASAAARQRQWDLWKENVRRFVAGERLLCEVD